MAFLRSIKLSGFLSFPPDSASIDLRPLNVLIGPNGSGKSNLIEAIELLHAAPTALALFGLLLIAVLQVFKVRASMLIGVLGTMLLGILVHQVHWDPTPFHVSAIKACGADLAPSISQSVSFFSSKVFMACICGGSCADVKAGKIRSPDGANGSAQSAAR